MKIFLDFKFCPHKMADFNDFKGHFDFDSFESQDIRAGMCGRLFSVVVFERKLVSRPKMEK